MKVINKQAQTMQQSQVHRSR